MECKNNRYVVYNRMDILISIMLLVACICYLPMLLGMKYISIGMVLFFCVGIIFGIKRNGTIHLAKKTGLRVYVSSMLLFSYCFIQSIALRSDRLQAGIQTIVLLVFSTTLFYILLSDERVKTLFIKGMYFLLIFFSVSYVISVIIMLISSWDSILITSYDYGYFKETEIFFPFTTTYGNMAFNGIVFKRLLGFARESGIMQIFYIWAFFMTDRYFEKVAFVRVLLTIGIVACLSTAGFIVFGVSLFLYMDIKKVLSRRTIIVLALFAVVIYILFFAAGTRIEDRATGTIEQRILAIEFGLNVFKQHPIFGGGFYSTLGNSEIQSGICALSLLGQVGAVGIGLWLMIFLFAFIDSGNKKRFLYANAALFVTAIFAQPMVFAPVMYWFLYVDYDDSRVILIRHNSKEEKELLGSER